jgi:hypothetical protein
VVWSIRNNVNLQQSALLIALNEVATNREEYLHNFWVKSKRSVAKARMEGPAGYVLPGDDPRPGQQARTLQTLQRHGIEVHRATSPFTAGGESFPAGSYVVRMDQPYSRGADMLLDRQYYSPNDPRPYDDVGWTFGPLYNAKTVRVDDVALLDAAMDLVEGEVRAPGGVIEADADATTAYVVRYNADNNLAAFRFAHPDLRIQAARSAFEAAGRSFSPGSFIIPVDGNGRDLGRTLEEAGREYGFEAVAVAQLPAVESHAVAVPRVALMHTWLTTQNEGWLRLGLDEYGIPYDYVSVHVIRDTPNLKDRWDVILVGPSVNDPLQLLHGVQGPRPHSLAGHRAHAPHRTAGLHLRHPGRPRAPGNHEPPALRRGGGDPRDPHELVDPPDPLRDDPRGVHPEHLGPLGPRGRVPHHPVRRRKPPGLGVRRGARGLLQQRPRPERRPPRPGAPPLQPDGSTTDRRSGRGGIDENDVVQGHGRDWGQESVRPTVPGMQAEGGGRGRRRRRIRRWRRRPGGPGRPGPDHLPLRRGSHQLLISGGLVNGLELTGSPALVDARVGQGHVVMFSFNPFWRGGTQGSYALVFNALLHHGNLHAGSAMAKDAEDR